jgi:hypothetical protein
MVNVTDCYPIGAGFDFRVMHGFFPHVEKVNAIGRTNLLKEAKHCVAIPKMTGLT